MHISHPDPSAYQKQCTLQHTFREQFSPSFDLLHPVATRRCFQFPETRLIQYDCGKLQTLDTLLRQLKQGGHRSVRLCIYQGFSLPFSLCSPIQGTDFHTDGTYAWCAGDIPQLSWSCIPEAWWGYSCTEETSAHILCGIACVTLHTSWFALVSDGQI